MLAKGVTQEEAEANAALILKFLKLGSRGGEVFDLVRYHEKIFDQKVGGRWRRKLAEPASASAWRLSTVEPDAASDAERAEAGRQALVALLAAIEAAEEEADPQPEQELDALESVVKAAGLTEEIARINLEGLEQMGALMQESGQAPPDLIDLSLRVPGTSLNLRVEAGAAGLDVRNARGGAPIDLSAEGIVAAAKQAAKPPKSSSSNNDPAPTPTPTPTPAPTSTRAVELADVAASASYIDDQDTWSLPQQTIDALAAPLEFRRSSVAADGTLTVVGQAVLTARAQEQGLGVVQFDLANGRRFDLLYQPGASNRVVVIREAGNPPAVAFAVDPEVAAADARFPTAASRFYYQHANGERDTFFFGADGVLLGALVRDGQTEGAVNLLSRVVE